jgi:molybdopterin synthase sulfur carrier subunit
MTVLTFGVVTDIIGKSNLTLEDVPSTDELTKKLEAEFPRLKTINYAIAVNKQIIKATTSLDSHATVALLPPFSGG